MAAWAINAFLLRGLADMTGRFGCPACGDPVWPRGH
jgi:hypothetical protein